VYRSVATSVPFNFLMQSVNFSVKFLRYYGNSDMSRLDKGENKTRVP